MSTEVGSLQANLTLDLSEFRAGIDSAVQLANELSIALRNTFDTDVGIGAMKQQLAEMDAAIKLLQASVEGFQAKMNSMSGADLFAQMRTHTAALPADIQQIQTALQGCIPVVTSLANEFGNAATQANGVSAAVQGIAPTISQAATSVQTLTTQLQGAATAAQGMQFPSDIAVPSFAASLAELQQMQALIEQIANALQQLNTGNNTTGTQGTIYIDPAIMQQLSMVEAYFSTIEGAVLLVNSAIEQVIANATTWSDIMRNIAQYTNAIASNLGMTTQPMQRFVQAMMRSATGAGNVNTQVNKVKKGLQTTKGYAVSFKQIIEGIIVSQSFYRLLNIVQELVNGAAEFSKTMQDAGVAFGYLMKDASVSSEAFLNALKDIAIQSPLDTTDLTAAARKLMAMGFSAEAAVPALSILTDTAAVFSNSAGDMADQISHIALAFGQMLASGKVSAQELRQLYNAGLPIYELLSEGLGLTIKEAKNIGHLGVDSGQAVYAVLEQLKTRYAGAAESLSHTYAGAISVCKESLQQLLSYGWDKIFQRLTGFVDNLARHMRALVKITQAYGFGGLFQAIVPQNAWGPMREGLASILSLLKALGNLLLAIKNIWVSTFAGFLGPVNMAIQGLSLLINVVTALIRYLWVASPAVQMVVKVIAMLAIAGLAAKVVLALAKALYILTGARAVVRTLGGVLSGIGSLIAWCPPAAAAILALAAALLAVVAASSKVRAALSGLFGGVKSGVSNALQSIDMGFDPGSMAMPEFNPPDTADFSSGLEDLISGMEDLGDETDKTGKKMKKNLQSFDEVYQIETQDDSGAGDALKGLQDFAAGIGNLSFDNMMDWTGDWAEDWGNLTAGMDGLMDGIEGGLDQLSEWFENFFGILTGGADAATGLSELSDALSILFTLFGKYNLAGILQIVAGIQEVMDAIKSIETDGANIDNVVELIHGIGRIVTGVGLLVAGATGNYSLVGIGLILQGLSDLVADIKKLATEGFDVGGVLAVIDDIGLICAGIGLLVQNNKLTGAGLFFSGLATVIQQLADNWAAIKNGDWSGVDKLAMVLGVLEALSGVLVFLGILGKAKGAIKGQEAADAVAEAAGATGSAGDAVGGQLNPKMTGLAKNLGMGLVILGEVIIAAGTIVAAIWGIGEMLGQIVQAWQPVIDNSDVVLTALAAGAVLLGGIGLICNTLGNAGTGMIVNMALGTAVLAEVGVATGLFLAEVIAIGLLLNKIAETWAPVLEQQELITTAITTGTIMLAAIGVVCGLLGVAGAGLIIAMALGTAVLAEMSIATDLFLIEIALIGTLLHQVAVAWEPVLREAPLVEQGIAQGTLLLVAVGAVCAALGVATVASAGLLPLAIGLGTALLVEMGIACVALVESITNVANTITNDLSPALRNINGILPQAKSDMDDFVVFMADFAGSVSSYTKSMGSMTWSSLVQGFLSIFAGDPLGDMVNNVSNTYDKICQLNQKLDPAVTELSTAVQLMTDYNALLDEMKILSNNEFGELNSAAFSNFKEFGQKLVLGLKEGISSNRGEVKTEMDGLGNDLTQWFETHCKTDMFVPYGKNIMAGMQNGVQAQFAIWVPAWMNTNVKTKLHTYMAATFASSNWEIYGEMIDKGIMRGIDNMWDDVMRKADQLAAAAAAAIAAALEVASPSKVTTRIGQFVDRGLIVGMDDERRNVLKTAASLAGQLGEQLGDIETPDTILSNSTNKLLTDVKSWSVQFIEIVDSTFNQLGSLFDGLSERLAATNLSNIETGINARIGSISAADNLASPTAATGTITATEVIASLRQETIESLSSTIALRMYEYLVPLLAQMSPEDQDRVLMYVGTLVADDAGLKALERKLYNIRQTESTRR